MMRKCSDALTFATPVGTVRSKKLVMGDVMRNSRNARGGLFS
jgi:hypothetical protein